MKISKSISKKKKYENILIGVFVWSIAVIIYLVPFYYIIINSIKNLKESTVLSLKLPSEIVINNFVVAFIEGDMLRGLMNSVIIVAISVSSIIICSALAAFYIQRSKTKFANFLYYFFVAGIALPISIITTFALLQNIGLLNTLIGASAVYIAIRMPFIIFIYVGFLKTVPRELDEAAIIDGCSQLGIFVRVIIPLLSTVTVTSIIISSQFVWNNFDVILFFIQSYDKFTLPLAIYNFAGMYHTQWNLIFAGSIITVLPVLLIYILGQRYIIAGLTSGAVKG
ncbi:MAG: ABC transporter permease subunit [Candidatus Lokiarchaeota archaeon]|nr:ABC transporter permease subunit [Candidatus Lokiarchaeota archaeon]